MKKIHRFKSISEFHNYSNLPRPEHPLISLVDYSKVNYSAEFDEIKWMQDFYSIGLKRNVSEKFSYGQQKYDFDEGVFSFVAPKQMLTIKINQNIKVNASGWLLLIHPDFFWNTSLAKSIKNYDFFGYAVNEALFLSEKEEHIIIEILKNIQREYQSNIDKFCQNIIISQIELLLNYAVRYYERQFITRKISNHQILIKLEQTLNNYFNNRETLINGIPSVVQLGFEYPASFSKLFKNKTNISPIEFRQSFN